MAEAGRQQERVTREGGTALEIPSARTSSLGHIPTATSLSPSVTPPPTSSSHFHLSHTPEASEGRDSFGESCHLPLPILDTPVSNQRR